MTPNGPRGERKTRVAKFRYRKLYKALPRERLYARLATRGETRLRWVCGPPGSGKTTLVASYVENSGIPAIWYRMDADDSDPGTFFYLLRKVATKTYRGAARLPLLTPEYQADVPGFARLFFRQLFSTLPETVALVLDNYQDAATSTLDAIVMEAARVAERARIFVTSRSEPPANFELASFQPLVQVLRWEDLRLLPAEAREIARAANILDKHLLDMLEVAADGWAAGLRLMVEVLRKGAAVDARFSETVRDVVYGHFAAEFFDKLATREKNILVRTAAMPTFTAEQAIALTSDPLADRFILSLYRQNFFLYRHGDASAMYQYHALFREFLTRQARALLGDSAFRGLTLSAARLLADTEQIPEAIALFSAANAWSESVRLILDHAPKLIQQGRHRALEAWIAALPTGVVATSSPWVRYWQGIAQIPLSPAGGRSSLEQAYAGFEQAGDAVGCVQACAAILHSVFLEWGDQRISDRWLAILEKRMSEPPLKGSAAIDLLVLPALSAALLRHLGNPFLAGVFDRTYERLREIADVEQRLAALVTVGYFLALRGESARGQRLLDQAVIALRGQPLSAFAELNLAGVELVYAHLVFDRDDYAANQAEVERCLQLAAATGIHSLDVLIIGQGVYLALKAGDLARARYLRDAAIAAVDIRRELDFAHVSLLKSAVALASGDAALAYEYGSECLRIGIENNHLYGVAQVHVWLAHALWVMGRAEEAWECIERILTITRQISARGLEYLGLLSRAYFQLSACQGGVGLESLKAAFAFGKLNGQITPGPWCDLPVMQYLCEQALLNDIETEFVCHTVECLKLQPPSADIESWPWPVRIYTLGSFRIHLRGVALPSISKQQRRPIELLKALIALGARNVRIEKLQGIVWRDDAHDQRAAFDMAVMRLRKILGHADAILVEEGRVSLNDQLIWVDALILDGRIGKRRALAATEVDLWLAQYRGQFLTEEGEESWVVPMRDRLAAKFRSEVRRAAKDCEAKSDWEGARSMYDKALHVDNLTEEFYWRLMYCLQKLGRTSDALNVYYRCRHILSVVLRARPSPETELLYQSLIRG